jgi:DNA-binding response OmpR family regulator
MSVNLSTHTLSDGGTRVRPTVLIIDDDPNTCQVLGAQLHSEGFTCTKAFDGLTALSLIRKNKPDLIILDVAMPGVSGFGVVSTLRKTKVDTPLLIFTCLDLTKSEQKRLALRRTKFLQKGSTSHFELVLAVRDLLKKQSNDGGRLF